MNGGDRSLLKDPLPPLFLVTVHQQSSRFQLTLLQRNHCLHYQTNQIQESPHLRNPSCLKKTS